MRLFASLSKVEEQDDGSLKVFGIASSGARDDAGEIVSPEAMKAALPDYMKWGAIREMHGSSAAGTAIEASVDDDGFTNLVAHVVDPIAVKKVKSGTYKGFSIGGKVLKRDPKDPTIITALRLVETSLVDRPCNPEASINMWKADMADPQEQAMSESTYTPPAEAVRAKAAEMAKAAGEPEKNASNWLHKAMTTLRAEHEAEEAAKAAAGGAVEPDPVEAPPVTAKPAPEPAPAVAKADPAADLLKAVADLQATLHPVDPASETVSPITPGLADFGKGLGQLVAKQEALGKGLYGVSRMFEIISSLVNMQSSSAWEEQREGDTTSTAPKDLAALVNQAGQIALNMAKEELAECMMDMKNEMPEVDIGPDFELAAAAVDLVKADAALMEKAGKRNSAKDAAAIQASHDHMVGLGAKCDKANVEKGAGADDLAKVTAEYEDLKKVVAGVAPQIAALREEVAVLKAQPLPPKTAGSNLAAVTGVSKGADAAGAVDQPQLSPEALEKAWDALPAETRVHLAMKGAMARPIAVRF